MLVTSITEFLYSRMVYRSLLIVLLAGGMFGESSAQSVRRPDLDSLAAAIARHAAEVPGAVIGIAFQELGTDAGDTLYVNADARFHAASTMKVPVMIELFRRADAGALRLDQGILLVNRFASLVDGSPYELDAGDDSDSSMYRRVGTRVPVRELIDHMITRSSNLATNALIELVSASNANRTAHMLGASNIDVRRGVEDNQAFAAGMNNTTTARDLAVLLAAIEQGRAASARSCAEMRDILLHQEFSGEIPAGLPPGTPVAHKTGWITGVLHDAAVVYPRGRPPYVLVVLTRDIPQAAVARQLIADISRLVYAHVTAEPLALAAPSQRGPTHR